MERGADVGPSRRVGPVVGRPRRRVPLLLPHDVHDVGEAVHVGTARDGDVGARALPPAHVVHGRTGATPGPPPRHVPGREPGTAGKEYGQRGPRRPNRPRGRSFAYPGRGRGWYTGSSSTHAATTGTRARGKRPRSRWTGGPSTTGVERDPNPVRLGTGPQESQTTWQRWGNVRNVDPKEKGPFVATIPETSGACPQRKGKRTVVVRSGLGVRGECVRIPFHQGVHGDTWVPTPESRRSLTPTVLPPSTYTPPTHLSDGPVSRPPSPTSLLST